MSWPVVETRDLHRDDWVVALREDVITRPGHSEQFSRISLEHPGAVVVLAVDEDDRVMCLRQYRHTSGHEFVELPAGVVPLCRSGANPIQPKEVVGRLREAAMMLQQPNISALSNASED